MNPSSNLESDWIIKLADMPCAHLSRQCGVRSIHLLTRVLVLQLDFPLDRQSMARTSVSPCRASLRLVAGARGGIPPLSTVHSWPLGGLVDAPLRFVSSARGLQLHRLCWSCRPVAPCRMRSVKSQLSMDVEGDVHDREDMRA